MKLMIWMSNPHANMLNRCAGDNTCVRNTHFFPARSFLKKLLIAFLPAQLRAIYIICVYFDQLYSQISSQNKISIANINKTRYLLSGINLGNIYFKKQSIKINIPNHANGEIIATQICPDIKNSESFT